MCDERERLIGYLYDEVDAADRRQVEAHLGECHVCRAEIAGLRSARADLLAWAVPDHEPIWRPMAPPRPVPAWGAVPAWGLAAAASVVFAAGLAGGAATRFLWPSSSSGTSPALAEQGARESGRVTAGAAVTPADLAALEMRVLNHVRTEMRQQVQAVSAREPADRSGVTPVAAARIGNVNLDALARQLGEIERWKNEQDLWRHDQIGLNAEFDRKIGRLGRTTSTLDTQVTWDREQRMNMTRVNNIVSPDLGR